MLTLNKTIYYFFPCLYIAIVICVLFIVVLLVWILLMYYFKFKSKFWYLQPVYHLYDFNYYFYNKGIIMKELPKKNNYTDFKNIESVFIDKLDKDTINVFTSLIQQHYFKNKDNKYFPKTENIIPYLNNPKSIITVFYENKDHNKMSSDIKKKIIGCMTAHPLRVIINNYKIDFYVYYVDYLCVSKEHRGNQIAEKIIQTQEYTQRHLNRNISVSLFKREDELTGIVPMCVYKTYTFDMKNWELHKKTCHIIHNKDFKNYNILLVDSQNIYFLNDFLKTLLSKQKYDICVFLDISDLMELIVTKNIFIYMFMENNRILSCYFFRKVCTFVTKTTEFISLFSSIKNNWDDTIIDDNIFIEGFKLSLKKMVSYYNEKRNYSHLIVEDISDNNIIIKNLKIKTCPDTILPTAYFFYNFAYRPFQSNKVLIIC